MHTQPCDHPQTLEVERDESQVLCEETCDWGWDLQSGRFLLSNKGSHFYNFCCCRCLVAKSCLSLCHPMNWVFPIGFLCPWDLSGKNTEVGCYSLFQGSSQLEASRKLYLLLGRGSLPLSHLGSPCFTVTVVLK